MREMGGGAGPRLAHCSAAGRVSSPDSPGCLRAGEDRAGGGDGNILLNCYIDFPSNLYSPIISK